MVSAVFAGSVVATVFFLGWDWKKILFFVSLNEEEETKNATSYEESYG